ncbi:histidine kinase dimerization/phospho-acceptor domain-containing protein [Myxococcota bacterium]
MNTRPCMLVLDCLVAKLDEAQRAFHNIVERSTEGTIVVNAAGLVEYVNPAAERLLQRQSGQLLGQPLGFPIVSGATAEVDVVRSGGNPGIAEMRVTPSEWEGHSALMVSLRDVTARETVERDLVLYAEGLGRLNQTKSDFVSIASHELRTPLTSIKSAVDLVLHEKTGAVNAAQRRFLQMAERNINRLTVLLNDLLDISRVESGSIGLRLSERPLQEIAASAVSTFMPLALQNSIQLNLNVSPDLPKVCCDAEKTEQVFLNLIDNALKFTPEHGRIDVGVQPLQASQGSLRLVEASVADTGIGIPAAAAKYLFREVLSR